MTDDVSETMEKALAMAARGGLERRKGGFWTYPGCGIVESPSRDYEAPTEYVTKATVDACVRRGLLERSGPGYDAPAALTEAGRSHLDGDGYAPLP